MQSDIRNLQAANFAPRKVTRCSLLAWLPIHSPWVPWNAPEYPSCNEVTRSKRLNQALAH